MPTRFRSLHPEAPSAESSAALHAQISAMCAWAQATPGATFTVIAQHGSPHLAGVCVPGVLAGDQLNALLEALKAASGGHQLHWGVACFPRDGQDPAILADLALSAAANAAERNAPPGAPRELPRPISAAAQTGRATESEHTAPATLLRHFTANSDAASSALEHLLEQIIDNDPVATFVLNAEHVVTHWNKACAHMTGRSAQEMCNSRSHWMAFYPQARPILADLVLSGDTATLARMYGSSASKSHLIPGAYEAEAFFPHFQQGGRWLYFTAAPIRDPSGAIIGAIETLQDTTERHRAEERLQAHQNELEEVVRQRTAELEEANAHLAADAEKMRQTEDELLRRYTELTELAITLSDTKEQLVQSEKLASIGQLAAGVAHEINTPIGYLNSNLGALSGYVRNLLKLLEAVESITASPLCEDLQCKMAALKKELDIDYLKEDMPELISESMDGVQRVRKIVQDLKDFSRVDTSHERVPADLHQGIESVISLAVGETSGRATVMTRFGNIPLVECMQSEINQVFMNLIINAAQAMKGPPGQIVISSGMLGDSVWVEVADTGCGIPPENLAKIFDPFFTTKPVGFGTGLGLSLAYSIIQEHHGTIEVSSEPGQGACFRITLPVTQPPSPAPQEN